MKTRTPRVGSWLLLSADVVSAKALVWLARAGRDGELTPDAHLFFADRYERLAEFHRAGGRRARAARLHARAEAHRHSSGGGPPYAAAMALPRPARFIHTNAVGRRHAGPPDDAA